MHKIWMATVSDYVFWCKDVGFLRHHVEIVESFQFHSHKIFEKNPKSRIIEKHQVNEKNSVKLI